MVLSVAEPKQQRPMGAARRGVKCASAGSAASPSAQYWTTTYGTVCRRHADGRERGRCTLPPQRPLCYSRHGDCARQRRLAYQRFARFFFLAALPPPACRAPGLSARATSSSVSSRSARSSFECFGQYIRAAPSGPSSPSSRAAMPQDGWKARGQLL